jgi:hypothetical protein
MSSSCAGVSYSVFLRHSLSSVLDRLSISLVTRHLVARGLPDSRSTWAIFLAP